MSKNTIIVLVGILVLGLVGFFLLKPQTNTQVPPQTQEVSEPSPSESPQAATGGAMMKEEASMVKISSAGFSPKSITIKAGEKVIWTNDDSANHTVNSSPHPTHTDHPFLNLGLMKTGESKSVTFDTAGTYKYHDHLNPSLTGSITVE